MGGIAEPGEARVPFSPALPSRAPGRRPFRALGPCPDPTSQHAMLRDAVARRGQATHLPCDPGAKDLMPGSCIGRTSTKIDAASVLNRDSHEVSCSGAGQFSAEDRKDWQLKDGSTRGLHRVYRTWIEYLLKEPLWSCSLVWSAAKGLASLTRPGPLWMGEPFGHD